MLAVRRAKLAIVGGTGVMPRDKQGGLLHSPGQGLREEG